MIFLLKLPFIGNFLASHVLEGKKGGRIVGVARKNIDYRLFTMAAGFGAAQPGQPIRCSGNRDMARCIGLDEELSGPGNEGALGRH